MNLDILIILILGRIKRNTLKQTGFSEIFFLYSEKRKGNVFFRICAS